MEKFDNYRDYDQNFEETNVPRFKQSVDAITYSIEEGEYLHIENELVQQIKEKYSDDGVYAAWLNSQSKYSNLVRAQEAKYFPEVADLSPDIERHTLFLALVDTRQTRDKVVHAATISGLNINPKENNVNEINDQSSGFVVVDDLIRMGNFTKEDFNQFYTQLNFDLTKCISVETNFRIGRKVEPFNGLHTTDLAYLSIFKYLTSLEPTLGQAAVFASINRLTINSFNRFGLHWQYLLNRDNLITSESLRGLEYAPVMIPYDEKNVHLFTAKGLQLEEIYT